MSSRKVEKYWSKRVMETSNAMDIKEGLFKGTPQEIARDLREAALASPRTKRTKFASAMSMLTFYINRGGKNIPPARKKVLEEAKGWLRKGFEQDGKRSIVEKDFYEDLKK